MLRSGGGISSGRTKPPLKRPKSGYPRVTGSAAVPARFGFEEVKARRGRRIAQADAYLAARTGTYEYRCQRYRAAADVLRGWGLDDTHTVMDVGAGWTEFSALLHTEYGWRGRYIPVDACVDGRDLERDPLPRGADFIVCLELVEHLDDPLGFIERQLKMNAAWGVVISTPNPAVVNVYAMDATHRRAVERWALLTLGLDVERRSFFGAPRDSLLATWRNPGAERFERDAERVRGAWPERMPGWDE